MAVSNVGDGGSVSAGTGAGQGGRRVSLFGPGMVLPATAIMLVLGAYPVAVGIYQSFTNASLGGTSNFVGLANFASLLSSGTFYAVLWNTIRWTVVGTGCALIISTALAVLLAQRRHNAAFQLLWIVPWAMPPMTLAIIFLWLYTPLIGFLATWARHFGVTFPALLASPHLALWAVLVPAVWSTYPFGMLFIHAALVGMDPQVIDAARIDGCSGLQQFTRVKLPIIGSVVRVVALLDFLWLFNQFAVIWIMTKGGPGNSTQILGSYDYYLAFSVRNVGLSTAVGVIMLIILVVFVVCFLLLARKSYGAVGVSQ